MRNRISRCAQLLGAALLIAGMSVQAKQPTCANPLGKWQDQLHSILEIKKFDASTGAISGEYIGHSGSGSWQMVGWVNQAPVRSAEVCKGCKVDRTGVVTFAVRWTDPNRVTAWTGTCSVNPNSGHDYILASWNTSRPNSGFEWDHTRTGAEPFVPVE